MSILNNIEMYATTYKSAIESLHQLFGHKRNREIMTINKVNSTGTTTRIKFYTVKDESIINITCEVAAIVNAKIDKNGYAIFGGAQKNHREDTVSRVSQEVFFNDRHIKHSTLLFI